MLKSLIRRWRDYRSAIDARVADGAELLDSARPGWAWRVDHQRLDLASARNCMLGQVYGSYANGLQALSATPALKGGA